MRKREFLDLMREMLSNALPDRMSKLSVDDAATIVDAVFDLIVVVAGNGDEVRLPVGKFYAKPINRGGNVTNVKLGFTSYGKTDTKVKKMFEENGF